jgi:hypothetical protein
MSDYRLLIGFIEILQTVTTCNYSTISGSHILQLTTTRIKSSQSAVSSPTLSGNGFQRHSFLSFRVHVLYWLASISQLNLDFLFLQHLGTDSIENTASNISSTIVSCSCLRDRVTNIASPLVHWCVLWVCCLATGIVYRVIIIAPIFLGRCPSLSTHESESMLRTAERSFVGW